MENCNAKYFFYGFVVVLIIALTMGCSKATVEVSCDTPPMSIDLPVMPQPRNPEHDVLWIM